MTHEPLQPAITQLANACHDLAQPRRHTIHTDHGRRRIHLPPRYTQLHQAIATSRAGTHSGAYGSRTPCSTTALELLHQIDNTLTRMHPPPNKWPGWTLMRLHALPEQKWRPQDTNHLNRITTQLQSFTQRIDQLFDPPAVIQLKKPCPTCNNTNIWKIVDGEKTRQTALLLTQTECRCQVCGTTWTNDQYEFLGRILNAQEIS